MNDINSMNKERLAADAMHQRIANLDSLPAMPDVAAKLLQLSRDPETMAKDVAEVIEMDPAIVAQVMHYARSPWYGYHGEIETVEQAIFSVLGMEMVTNIAMGMSAGKVFTIPSTGYLSAKNLWQHAVYCAALSEALARVMPMHCKIKSGAAYLSGLLHNIGFMIVAHCFPDEFIELSKKAEMNLTMPMVELEKQHYGTTHADVAAKLMRRWNMPDQVIEVMQHHHDKEYTGEYQREVLLVQVVNRVLANMEIGDETNCALDDTVLEILGLKKETIYTVMANIFDSRTNLDSMIAQLAA